MRKLFTAPDTWTGGSVDLLIFVGHVSELSVRELIDALWQYGGLDGPFARRDLEPDRQRLAAIGAIDPDIDIVLRGVATFGNGDQLPATHHLMRDERGWWSYFGFPLSALSKTYPHLETSYRSPRPPEAVSDWLRALGQNLFHRCPFDGAMVGVLSLAGVDALAAAIKSGPPGKHNQGYLLRGDGVLTWHPPTDSAY